MIVSAIRIRHAALLLAVAASLAGAPLFAQGRNGAGGGAQGGAPGQTTQGGGGTGGSQLPARDPNTGATGDQTTATAIIRGRVVSSDSGTPVRRAQVRAQAGEIRANRLASTDAQGRFELKDLPAGRWTVTVSKAGFMTLRYGQKRPFEAGTPIDLRDGEVMARADFSMPKGAAINGHVFDEFGDPVANARVQVMRYQMIAGQRRLVPGGGADQTDDLGAYRIYGLAPGDYYVSATLRAGQGGPFDNNQDPDTTSYAATYYPGTGSLSEAQRLTLGVGQDQPNINFALQPVRTVKVAGTALNSGGTPLTNGTITLVLADAPGGGGFVNGNGGRVRPDGTFSIVNVAPGNYTLSALAGNGGRGGGFPRGGPGGTDDIEMASMPLTVGSADVAGVTIVTGKGASISGGVVAAEGSVAKLSTTAIQIVAQAVDAQPGPVGPRPARVDADGNFQLTNLSGQRYIRVQNLPAQWTLKSVIFNGQDVTDSALEFRGNAQATGLQVIISDKISSVNGTVTTAKGDVTIDYTVVVFPEDSTKWAYPSRFVKTGRGDQQGQFTITALPPDDHYLAVAVDYLEDGEGTDPQFLEQVKGRATSFALGEGESKSIALKVVNR